MHNCILFAYPYPLILLTTNNLITFVPEEQLLLGKRQQTLQN